MFKNDLTTLPPAKGRILVSEPFLSDPNFNRTAVLLCEHNDKGSFGFVLNQHLNLVLQDVLEIESMQDIPLYLGGPVQKDTLHILHCDESMADSSVEIIEGVYWGGDFEEVRRRLEENTLDLENYRFFVGYSGWGEEQLEQEIEQKSWFVADATREIIFEEDDELLWKTLLHKMGGGFRVLANAPESPNMN